MRLKVVAAIILLALGVLGLTVFLSRPTRPSPDSKAPVNLPVAQAVTNPAPEKTIPALAPPPVDSPPPVMQATNPAVNAQDRNAELMALAMNDDTNSLNTIWSEFANPDPEIRAGALAAVVQFGDRSVVPRLRELAAQTDDAAEKASILEAANFLELPSLTEERNAPMTNEPPDR